jgi:hypothetical protein
VIPNRNVKSESPAVVAGRESCISKSWRSRRSGIRDTSTHFSPTESGTIFMALSLSVIAVFSKNSLIHDIDELNRSYNFFRNLDCKKIMMNIRNGD